MTIKSPHQHQTHGKQLSMRIYSRRPLTRIDGTELVCYHRPILSRRFWQGASYDRLAYRIVSPQNELLGNATVGFKNQIFTLAAEISPVPPALQHYLSVGPAVPGFLIGVSDRSSYSNASLI